MANLNQYCSRIERILKDNLGINLTLPRPKVSFATTPDFSRNLIDTYGLSKRELDSVYRIGLGRKISEIDSEIYNEMFIDEITIHEELGILCPLGILTFYEDLFYKPGSDVKILAASYHFQTAPQNNNRPLYVRFEFDPIMTDYRDFIAKPIFHYHFSNYDSFHKHCHFPAGHFSMPNAYPSEHVEVQKHFQSHNAPDLQNFLKLLIDAELIIKN